MKAFRLLFFSNFPHLLHFLNLPPISYELVYGRLASSCGNTTAKTKVGIKDDLCIVLAFHAFVECLKVSVVWLQL